LRVFERDRRESLLDVLMDVQRDKNQRKWRIRELIARQIDKLTEIYHADIIF
jgi:serine/threonine-protein phosphatase 4 regulatory subunit 1